MNKLPAFILSTAITTLGTLTYAGDIATERTQAATLGIITFLQTATNEINDTVGKIQTLENQAGALIAQIQGGIAGLPVVQDLFQILNGVQNVIETGTGLAYSATNLEAFMRQRFDSYDNYLGQIQADGGIIRASFEQRFKEWNDGQRDAIRNIMKAHKIYADDINTEQARLQTLERLSLNSDGRMQALQVGHQIAIEEVKQMHKLREILMEQSNLHASYFATKQAMEAEKEAADTFITERTQVVPIDDGKGY